jgi:hypothetical protein
MNIKSIESELKANRFSPLWIRSCLPNPLLLANVLSQSSHPNICRGPVRRRLESSRVTAGSHPGARFTHCCGERCIPGRGNDIYIYRERVRERVERVENEKSVRERE